MADATEHPGVDALEGTWAYKLDSQPLEFLFWVSHKQIGFLLGILQTDWISFKYLPGL